MPPRKWIAFQLPVYKQAFMEEYKANVHDSMRTYDKESKTNCVDARCFHYVEKLITKYYTSDEVVKTPEMLEELKTMSEALPEVDPNDKSPSFVDDDGCINIGEDESD